MVKSEFYPSSIYDACKSKTGRKIVRILILFLLGLSLENCVGYLWHLGTGQLDIWVQKRPISEALTDPNVKEETKQKLREVENFREYGISRLGLEASAGFRSFVQLKREEVGWHVAACYPLRLESYTWWFPIAGTVPYKGYFDLEKAKEEEKKLKQLGLDTRIRVTAGYSTLGWFEDPVFSSQLRSESYEIGSLVFHEMAHATVYFPGDSSFNESYASFVEEEGIFHYLESSEGRDGPIQKEILKRKEESKLLRFLLMETAQRLKLLYASAEDDGRKLEGKRRIIDEFKNSLFARRNEFKLISVERLFKRDWNNEDFVGYLRYHSGTSFFKKEFESSGRNFREFHMRMRKLIRLSNEERKKLLESG
ncbi:aminopeptidase [Leptospira gomenensis]|uniref:Aminopeptidase n=1 Tax=Leptospira gomenensis TaxID=2484974 RepID=A0A5F1YCW5_9LEPT|nr:aminopeptidase [Leptospira gomenensis]TGK34908.1 aminopeptidase [Leptospira gomenensis]TGK38518.1 aminopeptidase [Leptospira gomenensis]TGK42041.1 aminopeptidase [Leptospira gomenensis]TGK56303.1 aminopeptidase [Leptospira gomenensis]